MNKRLLFSHDPRLPWLYMRAQWQRFFGLNVSQIDPLLFVGGGFSTRQWPLLHALGVRAVLSLQAERADSFAGTPPERVLRLHVIDYTAPSLEQLREGVAFLADAHAAGLPVLVHCRAGVGRAPTTAAAYLMMHHGMSAEAALARLRVARPIIGLNLLQISRLREWEHTLRSAAQHVPE